MSVASFFLRYKWIIIFYFVVSLILYWHKDKLDIENKFIILYRSVFGISFIDSFSSKYKEWVRLFGLIGIGIGFIGLVTIAVFLIGNLFSLFLQPSQQSGVSLVLPGVRIPGLGILPFWYWIISIFIIALTHEFGHGIVAKANDLSIERTGFLFLGPIIGAFVEPDEEDVKESSDVVQYAVYAAGPFVNIVTAVIALALIGFVLTPVQQGMVSADGVTFGSYYNQGSPVKNSSLEPGDVIKKVNGENISDANSFVNALSNIDPNESVRLDTVNKSVNINTIEHPSEEGKGFLGITRVSTSYDPLKPGFKFWNSLLSTLISFFEWLHVLSLGIGLFNLLPLPIVDGGRMTQTFLHRLFGEEEGNNKYAKVSMFFLFILLLNFFIPAVNWLVKIL